MNITPAELERLKQTGDWFAVYDDAFRIRKGEWVSPPFAMLNMSRQEVEKLYEEELKKSL